MSLTLDSYRTLGRTGLRISPLALGAATFGTEWGWGAGREESRRLFDRYLDQGGNFIDTADTYTDGSSERLLGEFARENRESLVLATKYSTIRRAGDPNSGGPHRKNMFAAVETSLRRLNTDYIDLFYLHVWDATTPGEEVMRGMDDLVRQGKIRYAGMSNVPAWQVARMQTTADLRGWSPLAALQIEYSLIQRGGERELIPMAGDLGLGVIPFSPLGGGLLTGKYRREDLADGDSASDDSARKRHNQRLGMVTERNLAIAEAVTDIAAELGHTPAQVALAWTLHNPTVTASLIGARTVAQLDDNVGALAVDLDDTRLGRLAEASAIERGYPHDLLGSAFIHEQVHGGMSITSRR